MRRVWEAQVWLLAVALLLAACSGGGGSSNNAALLVGSVFDTDVSAGGGVHAPVAGADVVLVPAGEVENIDSIQPMEDAAQAVLAGTMATGFSGVSDAAGAYSIAGVIDGDYFLVVLPTDGSHLPGGHRRVVTLAGGVLTDPSMADVEIVQNQTSAATYVGATTCLGCHNKPSLKHTLHFIGLRKIAPDGSTVANGLMDLSSTQPYDLPTIIPNAMSRFTPDAQGGPTAYTLAGTTNVVWLGIDATGAYFQVGAVTNPKYYVKLTYGGETGKWKARYVTIVGKADGLPATLWGANNATLGSGNGFGYFQMAPMQFQEKYTDGSNGVAGPFVAYHAERWDFAVAGSFTADVKTKSWDANCASCHGGTGVTDNGTDFLVHFPVDPEGYTLFDGTSTTYEINNSCEKCHGPGSEHVASGGQGKSIIQPELLTTGRLTMVCGNCHIRGHNNTAVGGEVAMLANGPENTVFTPGMSPAQYFGTLDGSGIAPFETDALTSGYLKPINFLSDSHSWKDIAHVQANPFVTSTAVGPRTQVTGSFNHSKGHHQQFMDLVRTKMFKNDHELVTCISCHDAHGKPIEHQLQADPDNNAICLMCHNDSLRAPAPGQTVPDESLEGKHPANFQFITQAMADRLELGTNTPADDAAIAAEVMRHVGKWANASMGSMPYDPTGTKMGRCIPCHMSKTAKSASFSNALLSAGGNRYLEGDIHAHSFDVMTTEAVGAMFGAVLNDPSKVTPCGMTNSCAVCHVAIVN